jgi:hypothetical protein
MLVKYDGVQRLRRVTRARDAEVLVCPAVVYELLRTRDSARRNAQVKAATLGAWTRMRTEVYIECNDFRSVAAARRPSWFHAEPDLRAYHALRADWSAGGWFWRRARHDTAAEVRRLAGLEGDLLARAREEAQKRREGMGAVHFDSVPLDGWHAEPKGSMPGWAGGTVDMWRLMSAGLWWSALVVDQRTPYLDWLEPFLDLRAIAKDHASFNSMWLYEVDVQVGNSNHAVEPKFAPPAAGFRRRPAQVPSLGWRLCE